MKHVSRQGATSRRASSSEAKTEPGQQGQQPAAEKEQVFHFKNDFKKQL
ncbi:hypothetical protein Hsw_PA0108 (plasmid) [Hymenobacter swuensis DY53]|uniref:Uncharacterized protein n=1 Tax=Hymenobacter swuensis DY53 TaxID=1227739 RepID=W8EYP7_9BACT|nr:hypothetical protein Hsw_PA0108 [Hymenobacter swuensis DY53]